MATLEECNNESVGCGHDPCAFFSNYKVQSKWGHFDLVEKPVNGKWKETLGRLNYACQNNFVVVGVWVIDDEDYSNPNFMP